MYAGNINYPVTKQSVYVGIRTIILPCNVKLDMYSN